MAKAVAGPRKTTRTIKLTITEGEADMLLALTSMAGGSRSKSPRKYSQRVHDALTKALGYKAIETDAYHLALGHVEFFNYDNHPDITPALHVLAVLESIGVQLHADFDPKFSLVPGVLEGLVHLFHYAESVAKDEVPA